MLRLTARYGHKTLHFPLPEAPRSRLGSAPDSDIVLPYPGVSREHALLLRRANGVVLRDLDSKNGLLCDGKRVGEVELEPGRAVQVGSGFVTLEELPSSDGIIALPLSGPPSGSATGSFTAHLGIDLGGPSGHELLRLVRRLPPGHQEASLEADLLADVCALVKADAVLVADLDQAHGGEERLVIRESHGAVDGALLGPLQEALSSGDGGVSPEEIPTNRGRWLLRLLGKEGNVLCAHFPPGNTTPLACDLLSFVAERLGAEPGERATAPVAPLLGTLDPPPGMVLGTSPASERVLASLRPALASSRDVLLLGETGTGKELFARLIHRSGPDRGGPFVAVNCAAIPTDQLEAELFGIGRGVATQVDARPGLFLQADGGTLLLDEIGEIPEAVQAKLLRAIEEREVRPVGAAGPRKISLRLIAASNRDLPAMARDGRFRPDLYYRLQKVEIRLPALRERREEIPGLVTAFVRECSAAEGKRIGGVTRRALDRLLAHSWPGNIRQLKTAVERAVLLCPDGGALESQHFDLDDPPTGSAPDGPAGVPAPETERAEARSIRPLQERLDEEERQAIQEALAATRGNKTQAARLLGISRPGLAMKIKRLGLEV